MSAESGIPTFRDAQTGMWQKFRPEELATPGAFQANPERVWRWYQWRRDLVRRSAPHGGHFALVELEILLRDLSIVTQNVDGLHQAAGSGRVIELHGNIMKSVCSETGLPIDVEWISKSSGSPPPSPHAAGALARPGVVWFGEPLPADALESAWKLARGAAACLSVGTSSVVEPAASLPLLASENGALLIEINPNETPLSSYADHRIPMAAGPALQQLLRECTALA